MTMLTKEIRIKSAGRYRVTNTLKLFGANGLVWLGVVLSLYPIIMMVLNSFKSDFELYQNPAGLPQNWTLDNYALVLSQAGRPFFSGIFVASVATAISVVLVALAAFAFAKYHFWGRNILFTLLLATLLVPGEITLSPLYLVFSNLHWLNTYQVQIVPFVAPVFGVFMVRQYMVTVPDALLDAARIDGATELQIFWSIIIPVSAPILGAFAILQFLGIWNGYLWPLIMANDPSVEPIMAFLPTNLVDPHLGMVPIWGAIMAGCVLATGPVIIVFLLFQRKFLSSVVVGAVRG